MPAFPIMHSTAHFVQLLRPQSIPWTRLWLPQFLVSRFAAYLLVLNPHVPSYRHLSQLRGTHTTLYFAIYLSHTNVVFNTLDTQKIRRCHISPPPIYHPPYSRWLIGWQLLPWHLTSLCLNRHCYNYKLREIELRPPPQRSLRFALFWDSQHAQ